jgi:hypothetical protein
MSVSEVFTINENGDVIEWGDAPNGHGGGPVVWMLMGEKYKRPYNMINEMMAMMGERRGESWFQIYSQSLTSPEDQVVIGWTLDGSWVKRENLPRLIEAIAAFNKDLLGPSDYCKTMFQVERHLREIAEKEPDIRGVCFKCTSVAESMWDSKGEENRPCNIDKDAPEAWEIFEDIEARRESRKTA